MKGDRGHTGEEVEDDRREAEEKKTYLSGRQRRKRKELVHDKRGRHDSRGTGIWSAWFDRRVYRSTLTQVNKQPGTLGDEVNRGSVWQQILKLRMDYWCPHIADLTVSVLHDLNCHEMRKNNLLSVIMNTEQRYKFTVVKTSYLQGSAAPSVFYIMNSSDVHIIHAALIQNICQT